MSIGSPHYQDSFPSVEHDSETDLPQIDNQNPNLVKCLKFLAHLAKPDITLKDKTEALLSLKSRTRLLKESNSELLKYL